MADVIDVSEVAQAESIGNLPGTARQLAQQARQAGEHFVQPGIAEQRLFQSGEVEAAQALGEVLQVHFARRAELLVQAIQTNDYNVTVVLSFVYSLMYVLMMLVVDVLYGVIDPRIRLTKEDG